MMLINFINTYDPESKAYVSRLSVPLPVPPNSDPFEKMTARHMEAFKEALEEMRDALRFAQDDPDEHAACAKMRSVFGEDFPVPDKPDTGTPRKRGITSSSESA